MIRVLVDCCLHERSWNPYYAHLALKLCQHGKAHRLTMTFCLWDLYKVGRSLRVLGGALVKDTAYLAVNLSPPQHHLLTSGLPMRPHSVRGNSVWISCSGRTFGFW